MAQSLSQIMVSSRSKPAAGVLAAPDRAEAFPNQLLPGANRGNLIVNAQETISSFLNFG
ncbi:hypothetical protein I6F35_13135 [Bradyrhizobium sp. BRP22]|uniref:hypothetical protein n=1 Tax=Bradyrhizobium sp. BRP22 TaxID=2793821 RepID=UPI001CD7B63E|nr:hypothetical protein [Bradyrhizobium sp. BRP22]MCA1454153.1 hypothetical protein [Bradyrhizobium sp. BRP22]